MRLSSKPFTPSEFLKFLFKPYTTFGYAKVKVNGRRGILIAIKTGSGQRDPL